MSVLLVVASVEKSAAIWTLVRAKISALPNEIVFSVASASVDTVAVAPVTNAFVFSLAIDLVIVAISFTFAAAKLAPRSTCICLPDGEPVSENLVSPSWLLPESEMISPTAPSLEPAVIIDSV